MGKQTDAIQAVVKKVSARKWLTYTRTLGADAITDVMNDPILVAVVAAAEWHEQTHGSPSLDRYLDMGTDELNVELDRMYPDDEDQAVAVEQFPDDQPGVAGSGPAGGVGADGVGPEPGADPGPALPSDGNPAVGVGPADPS